MIGSNTITYIQCTKLSFLFVPGSSTANRTGSLPVRGVGRDKVHINLKEFEPADHLGKTFWMI